MHASAGATVEWVPILQEQAVERVAPCIEPLSYAQGLIESYWRQRREGGRGEWHRTLRGRRSGVVRGQLGYPPGHGLMSYANNGEPTHKRTVTRFKTAQFPWPANIKRLLLIILVNSLTEPLCPWKYETRGLCTYVLARIFVLIRPSCHFYECFKLERELCANRKLKYQFFFIISNFFQQLKRHIKKHVVLLVAIKSTEKMNK